MTSIRVAYADPPYVGQAKKHYGCEEIDHPALIERLITEFPAGWALSCTSLSLRELLPLCPTETRVMAWVKPFVWFKPGVNPAYAWEPLLVCGGRKRQRSDSTVLDWVRVPITQRRGLVGAKPEAFCFWLFSVLGLLPGDELVDLFPGTGAVTRAWEQWTSNPLVLAL